MHLIKIAPLPPPPPQFVPPKAAPPPVQYTPPTSQFTPPSPQFTPAEPLRMKPAVPANKPTVLDNPPVRRSPSPTRQEVPASRPAASPYQQTQQYTPAPPPNQTANRANRWNNPAPNAADQKPMPVFNNVATGRPDNVPVSPASDHVMPCTTEQLQNAVKQALSSMEQRPMSPAVKPSQVGSLYIPPVEPQVDANVRCNKQTPLAHQQTPMWMQTRQGAPAAEQPQWVNREESDNGYAFGHPPSSTVNQQQVSPQTKPQENARAIYQQPPQAQMNHRQAAPQTMQFSTTTTSNNSQSSTVHKERIIPIQLEATPSPTKAPLTPGFGPQPYYNMGQQQYSSVQSPGGTVYHNSSPSECEGRKSNGGANFNFFSIFFQLLCHQRITIPINLLIKATTLSARTVKEDEWLRLRWRSITLVVPSWTNRLYCRGECDPGQRVAVESIINKQLIQALQCLQIYTPNSNKIIEKLIA